MENPIKMDDLGVTLFLETPTYPPENEWLEDKMSFSKIAPFQATFVHFEGCFFHFSFVSSHEKIFTIATG